MLKVALSIACGLALRVFLQSDELISWGLETNFALVSRRDSSLDAAEEKLLATFGRHSSSGMSVDLDPRIQTLAVELLLMLALALMASPDRRQWVFMVSYLNPASVLTAASTSTAYIRWAPVVLVCLLSARKTTVASQVSVFAAALAAVHLNDVGCLSFVTSMAAHGSPTPRQYVMKVLASFVAASSILYLCGVNVIRLTTSPRKGYPSPSLGTQWYMDQLMFADFEALFASVFRMLPIVVSLPLGWKASSRERGSSFTSVALAIVVMLSAKDFVLIDAVLVAMMVVALFPVTAASMKHTFITVTVVMLLLPLQQAFYRGWLRIQVANANFLFFANAIWCIGWLVFCIQFVSAFLRR